MSRGPSTRPPVHTSIHPPVSPVRLLALTAIVMVAFAANSVLCRLALGTTGIDPAGFTAIRLASGAAALWALARVRAGAGARSGGSWTSALALFGYGAAFSFAYVTLSTGTGALLLFGAVQLTMIGWGAARGERLLPLGVLGALLAFAGLVLLVAPGVTAPAPAGAALMLCAGVAWGVYSLRGRASADPSMDTAGNFLRAALPALALAAAFAPSLRVDAAGAAYAALSGAVASGMGYAVWYSVLPRMRAMTASLAQLCVPVLAAAGGVLLLGEPVTVRLALAALMTLGGIALALRAGVSRRAPPASRS